MRTLAVIATFLFLVAAACGRVADCPAPPKPSFRVVSLVPALTDCVLFNGLEDRLVAVSAFCDSTARARPGMTVIPDVLRPNFEELAALRPDLILTIAWHDDRTRSELDRLGLRVAVLPDPTTIAEIAANIAAVGALLGEERASARRAAAWEAEVDALLTTDTAATSLRLYIQLDPSGRWTAGNRSYLNEIVHRLGFTNIFADEAFGYGEMNEEVILTRDPEAVLLLYDAPASLARDRLLARTTAGRAGRIRPLVAWKTLTLPGPRILEGVREIKTWRAAIETAP